MHASGSTPEERRLAAIMPLLADLVALPTLGQGGRLHYAAFLRALLTIFGAHGTTIGFWVSPQQVRRFRVLAGEGGGDVHEDIADPGAGDTPYAGLLRQGGTLLLGAGDPDPGSVAADYPGHVSTSRLLLGLKLRDEPPAVLALHRFRDEPFTDADRSLALTASPLLASALDNLRRFARAEELSITDGLTGVYNYRYLRSALDKEVARARRFHEKFSIIMLDVDHLKEYNDMHGHLRGSEVLRQLALLITAEMRGADIVAKYGGDEFVIVLAQTDRAGAQILAERIRSSVEAHAFPGEDTGIRITSSMGIAQFPDDAQTARDLLDAADAALYAAKRTGRNRVASQAPGS